MSVQKHTIQTLDGSSPNFSDRVIVGQQFNVAVTNGVNPTVAVVFTEGLPPNYGVYVMSNQSMFAYVTAKTSTGFTVNLVGTASGGTCVIDVLVFAA